jgi:hypothetical protein
MASETKEVTIIKENADGTIIIGTKINVFNSNGAAKPQTESEQPILIGAKINVFNSSGMAKLQAEKDQLRERYLPRPKKVTNDKKEQAKPPVSEDAQTHSNEVRSTTDKRPTLKIVKG